VPLKEVLIIYASCVIIVRPWIEIRCRMLSVFAVLKRRANFQRIEWYTVYMRSVLHSSNSLFCDFAILKCFKLLFPGAALTAFATVHAELQSPDLSAETWPPYTQSLYDPITTRVCGLPYKYLYNVRSCTANAEKSAILRVVVHS
jgi:hypothetical protein